MSGRGPGGSPPHIVHVIYRFAMGGLENGLVNLVNQLPAGAWRHTIVSLTDVDPAFSSRMRDDRAEIVALGKKSGHAHGVYPRLWRLLRQWRPAIVHTRDLATQEVVPVAWAAGVPVRVHPAPPFGEVGAGRLGLVHGGLGLLGLLPLAHDLPRLGKPFAELFGAGIGARRELRRGCPPAPQRARQTRSQSDPTGQEQCGFHDARCYTAASSCLTSTAGPSGGNPGEADRDRRKEPLGT